MDQSRKRMGIVLAAVWLAMVLGPVFAEEDARPGFRQEGVSPGTETKRKRPKGAAKTTVEVIEVRGTKKSEAESAFSKRYHPS